MTRGEHHDARVALLALASKMGIELPSQMTMDAMLRVIARNLDWEEIERRGKVERPKVLARSIALVAVLRYRQRHGLVGLPESVGALPALRVIRGKVQL